MTKKVLIAIVVIGLLALIGKIAIQPNENSDQSLDDLENKLQSEQPESTSSAKLEIEDIKVGNGREVKSGDTVSMHYAGTLQDGTKFDSSYDRGTPFETQIGVGQVIKGWDQGVPGMKVGGKRKLIIPPYLGYGSRGAGAKIPPNSTLVFEVELLDVK